MIEPMSKDEALALVVMLGGENNNWALHQVYLRLNTAQRVEFHRVVGATWPKPHHKQNKVNWNDAWATALARASLIRQ